MGRKCKPRLPGGIDWPDATTEWYEGWRESVRTDGWDAQQWAYLADTALVHARVWGSFDFSALPELHRREAFMGLSFDSKAKAASGGKPTVLQMVISDRKGKERRASSA